MKTCLLFDYQNFANPAASIFEQVGTHIDMTGTKRLFSDIETAERHQKIRNALDLNAFRKRFKADKMYVFDAVRDGSGHGWHQKFEGTHYKYGHIKGDTARKARQKAVDSNLVVHAMKFAANNTFDKFVIFAGDLDYLPLVEDLTDQGKTVVVVAWAKSLGQDTLLRNAADALICFSLLDLRHVLHANPSSFGAEPIFINKASAASVAFVAPMVTPVDRHGVKFFLMRSQGQQTRFHIAREFESEESWRTHVALSENEMLQTDEESYAKTLFALC